MSLTMKASQATAYNDKVVRQFAIMTVVYGVVDVGGRDLRLSSHSRR